MSINATLASPPTGSPVGHRTTIYYNGACPVCDAGVCAMKARTASDTVAWVDVNSHPEMLAPLGLNLEDVRERLHLVDAGGQLHIGAPAIVAAWSLQAHWGWLSKPLAWFGLRTLSDWAYNGIARQLYRWNRRQGNW